MAILELVLLEGPLVGVDDPVPRDSGISVCSRLDHAIGFLQGETISTARSGAPSTSLEVMSLFLSSLHVLEGSKGFVVR